MNCLPGKIAALLIALIVALGGDIALAQQARRAPATQDTVFNEIELSSEGVAAVDTVGRHWIYSFDSSQFVPDTRTAATNRTGEGFGREAAVAPVEKRCTQEKVVKPLQRAVLIGYDEYTGPILAYGRVTVKGWVKGNIQSVSGRVLVTQWGQVDGDIKAPEIVVEDGGLVKGRQITTNVLDFPSEMLSRPFSADGLVIVLAFTILFLVIGFLIIALLPRHFGNFKECLIRYKARSMFIGVLFLFLLPLIALLFAITIVGVVFLPFIPLAYVLAMAAGIVSVGSALGSAIFRRLWSHNNSALIHASVGTLVFMLPWVLVAILLGSSSEVAKGFGVFVLVLSIAITSYPVLAGIGAAFLTRFGSRLHVGSGFTRGRASEAPAPAPPPIPDMPGFVSPPPMPPSPPQGSAPNRSQPLGPDFKPPLSTGNS